MIKGNNNNNDNTKIVNIEKNLLKIICQSLIGKLRINSNSLLFTLIPQILIVRAGTNNKHVHGKMINNNLGEAKSELKKSETKKMNIFIPVIKISWNKYVEGLYKRDFNSYKNKFENKLSLIFIDFINL